MIARREWLRLSLGSGAALALNPRLLQALQSQEIIARAIPSTGERIPVVGFGTSATFAQVAATEDVNVLDGVLRTLVEMGGAVFDTVPSFGASEEVAGRVERMGMRPIDLNQVHQLDDIPTQLGIPGQSKQEKRIRYIGVTATSERQYQQLEITVRNEPLDFIGIDYAIDNREIGTTILPLARERKIGVLVYAPFGRTRLWRRVEGRELPAWAVDFDSHTWAHFFLEFISPRAAPRDATMPSASY